MSQCNPRPPSLASKVREAEAEQGVMIDALLTRFGVMQVRASEREREQIARATRACARARARVLLPRFSRSVL